MVVAQAAPFDEVVFGGPLDCRRNRVGATQHDRVTGPDGQIGSAADKPGAALEYADPRRLVRSPNFDVVNAALEQPDTAPGDIDLDAFVRAELAQIDLDPPLRHVGLQDTVAKIGDVELGVAPDIDCFGADTNFGPRLRIGRKPLPSGDRIVDLGRRPGAVSWAVKGERTRDEAHPADPGRGLLPSEGRGEGWGAGEESQREEGCCGRAHGPFP